MKRIILSYLFILFAFASSYAQDSINTKTDSVPAATTGAVAQNDTDKIEAMYNEGDFRKVIDALEKEKNDKKALGQESAELYYNLGNAYFRINDIAKARLNYERALLLDPGDRDTKHNIEYIMTKIEDKIPVADTFFLNIWFNAVQNLFSSNTWATIGVVSFILFIVGLVLFFFSRSIFIKKTAFYTGIILIIIIIFANIFSFRQKSKIERRDTAVVMAGSASIVSSPELNSKELTILHAGTKVTVTKEDRNWIEIEIENGTIGWIQRDKLEII
ncbi:MAG: tetratricopeptide repeat protein [Prevotella sp.]|nr:tetratricopeptide repeat protein [Prevotella sp.]